ncbi:MAG: MFS transporter, partial [Pseudomonadota bacterium]
SVDRRALWILSFIFAVAAFTSTAMATHLPAILTAAGASAVVAIGAGALIGPSQVVARISEHVFFRKRHPIFATRLGFAAHPIAVIGLLSLGAPFAFAFAILLGAGAGILTIAKGTLPLSLLGAQNYGYSLGVISVPSRIAQAMAPLVFGIALTSVGPYAVVLTFGLGVLALVAIQFLSLR